MLPPQDANDRAVASSGALWAPVIALGVGVLDWLFLVAIGWSPKAADCGLGGLEFVPVLALLGFITTPLEIWAFGVVPFLIGLFVLSRAGLGEGSPVEGRGRRKVLATAIVCIWVVLANHLSHRRALGDLDVGAPPFAVGVVGNVVLAWASPRARRYQWLVLAALALVTAATWYAFSRSYGGRPCIRW